MTILPDSDLSERLLGTLNTCEVTVLLACSGRHLCRLSANSLLLGMELKERISVMIGSQPLESDPIEPLDVYQMRLFVGETELRDDVRLGDSLSEWQEDLHVSVVVRPEECAGYLRELDWISDAPQRLAMAGAYVQSDRECVMAAVRRNGNALQFLESKQGYFFDKGASGGAPPPGPPLKSAWRLADIFHQIQQAY